jgi:crotonobetainyl-CoA:carnitine CoA-transferase CaiB-like acyl-CoA transferase
VWFYTFLLVLPSPAAQRHHIPTAAVRDLEEVVNDEHLHQRGMLQWIDHPVVGRIAAPHSPIKVHGVEPMELTLNPEVGEHNDSVYGEWMGLDEAEIASLREEGAI